MQRPRSRFNVRYWPSQCVLRRRAMCDRDCATKEGWSAIGAAQLRSANVSTERPTLFEQQKGRGANRGLGVGELTLAAFAALLGGFLLRTARRFLRSFLGRLLCRFLRGFLGGLFCRLLGSLFRRLLSGFLHRLFHRLLRCFLGGLLGSALPRLTRDGRT